MEWKIEKGRRGSKIIQSSDQRKEPRDGGRRMKDDLGDELGGAKKLQARRSCCSSVDEVPILVFTIPSEIASRASRVPGMGGGNKRAENVSLLERAWRWPK